MPVPDGALANPATAGGSMVASEAVMEATDGVENGAGSKPMCFFLLFFSPAPGWYLYQPGDGFFLFFFHLRFFFPTVMARVFFQPPTQ
jgi:hypothetical protein